MLFHLSWYSPEQSTEAEWHRLLFDSKPDVIVAAWSMPSLPEAYLIHPNRLKYFCYFCGSLKGKVPASYIESGGLVTNWGGLAARTVAECALTLVLACMRQVTRFSLEMHVEKKWDQMGKPVPQTLFDKRIGIHGFGAVARELHALLVPFFNQITFWSEGVPKKVFEAHGVEQAESLEALFDDNDVVIEAEALTAASRSTVTSEILNRLKSGSLFVNVGRGDLLEPGAVEALASRRDVAIGLDVYTVEPLPAESPLRGNPFVTLLPHTAGPTLDEYLRIRDNCLDLLRDYLSGQPLKNAMSIEAYERMT